CRSERALSITNARRVADWQVRNTNCRIEIRIHRTCRQRQIVINIRADWHITHFGTWQPNIYNSRTAVPGAGAVEDREWISSVYAEDGSELPPTEYVLHQTRMILECQECRLPDSAEDEAVSNIKISITTIKPWEERIEVAKIEVVGGLRES